MDRAYSCLEIKAFDPEQRVIEGLASSPEPDRRGDVLIPEGAEFALPMPLLWQHDTTQPIGEVTAATVTPAGIQITAKFAQVQEPGRLRDRLEEAWQSVKSRLVRGLSVGFKPLDAAPVRKGDPFGPMRVTRWMWAETSAVTLPMNVAATITAIKSAAAPGRSVDLPGDTGVLPVVRVKERTAMQQTYAEQIAAHEAKRGTVLASMNELMTKSNTEGTTLEGAEQQQYDGLSVQVKSLDAHLARLRELETLNAAAARPLPVPGPAPVVQIKSNLPPGTAFVRGCMAMLQSKGDSQRALNIASRWTDTPEVALMIKAAVLPGTTTDPAWAGALVTVQNLTNEFIALLRPATIVGKIPNLRQVPFNASVPVQTAGGTYGWVGQAKPKPVTKLGLGTATLDFSKAAGIIILTEELVKLSSPSAEAIVRADMIAGIAQFLDQQFTDPAVAAVASVNPASITNGAETAASTDSPYGDLAKLIGYFSTNGIPIGGAVVIMNETNALAMALTGNGAGGLLFPGMSVNGGTAAGLTVIASNVVGSNVIILQPSMILYADEGGVAIDVSREASVIMDSAPPTDGTGTLTSLWQNNLVGLRAERMVNWKRGVAKSVYYLTDAVYPAVVSPTAMGASLAPAAAPATAARPAGARDAAVRA